MTCCAICKITLGKSIEENECGCPTFNDCDGEITIVWRGYPMRLKEFRLIQKSANPTAVIKN